MNEILTKKAWKHIIKIFTKPEYRIKYYHTKDLWQNVKKNMESW